MVQINNGRFTTQMDKPFVVFLIGMRVNRTFAFSRWLPVMGAFPKMLDVLRAHPEKGFLSGEFFLRLYPIMPVMISYWRSFEDLEQFARSADDPHLAAWQDFYRRVGKDGSVGVWHETYQVEPGNFEAVYLNMPVYGLAGAAGRVFPVGKGTNAARERINADKLPADSSSRASTSTPGY